MGSPSTWMKALDCLADDGSEEDEMMMEGNGKDESMRGDAQTNGDGESVAERAMKRGPQKRYFRQRAHMNPLSDPLFPFPLSPYHVDWHSFYPEKFPARTGPEPDLAEHALSELVPADRPHIDMLDVGCGYGGLTGKDTAVLMPVHMPMPMGMNDMHAHTCFYTIAMLYSVSCGLVNVCQWVLFGTAMIHREFSWTFYREH